VTADHALIHGRPRDCSADGLRASAAAHHSPHGASPAPSSCGSSVATTRARRAFQQQVPTVSGASDMPSPPMRRRTRHPAGRRWRA
jgi:hypothetical protein